MDNLHCLEALTNVKEAYLLRHQNYAVDTLRVSFLEEAIANNSWTGFCRRRVTERTYLKRRICLDVEFAPHKFGRLSLPDVKIDNFFH